MKKGVGLQYALHNKGAWGVLGYLHATFERGERISDDWKLYLGYYTVSKQEDHFQLTESMFTDSAQFRALTAKCRTLDKDFDKDRTAGWNPYFVHVPTRKRLPLGGPVDSDWADISKYVKKQIEEGLSGKDEGPNFSNISDEVFVRRDERS